MPLLQSGGGKQNPESKTLLKCRVHHRGQIGASTLPDSGAVRSIYLARPKNDQCGFPAVQTFSLSLMVGVTCTFYSGALVLEALVLTAAVVFGLTAYTFYAVKRGADFG